MSTATKTRWVVDPSHTDAQFSVKHMMIATVRGHFAKVSGQIEGDLPDLTTAQITAEVDVASLETRDPQRDAHLRSADFFDVENHPTLTFVSKRIVRTGDDQYDVVGDLTIRGVTREVTLKTAFEGTGKDPWGNERAGLSGDATISRKEFGLNWNAALETGGVLVGDDVKIGIQAELIKQA